MNKTTEPLTREEIIEEVKKNLELLTPRQVSNFAIMLSAYLSTLGEELAHAEIAYYKKLCDIRGYESSER